MDANIIPVGDLSIGFSENAIPSTDKLVGTQVGLFFESGKKARITFLDAETLFELKSHFDEIECALWVNPGNL